MNATIDFGIDLGTTNSCIARYEAGGIRVFQSNDQMNVTPSAVYLNRAGRKIIGLRAYSALRTDPNNVALEFKRLMGTKDRRTFTDAKQSLSAEELSAEILKSLREDVRRHTGIDMTTAVITVPAAFGTLQCEATARAAQLAGIVEAPLLQEPIAAAVGYGVRTEGINQRWLVFDLGGGTLDIAVVSTRDGRLNVLEHIGNNLRGGKDIDRLIVDEIFLPAVRKRFDIHLSEGTPGIHPLLLKLRSEAERAKIALSTDTRVAVSLFELGNDDSGKPIELEVELTRTQLESLLEPMLDECLDLARSALLTARVAAGDLDRILLVGGPTQTPIIRSRLAQELGAPVDFSLDPMTVVARGAALYASTLQRTGVSIPTPAINSVPLKLAYEPVSAELTCEIEGRVESTVNGLEAKADADGGFWTSGWVPLRGDAFVLKVQLREGEVTTFRISLRDARGRMLEIDAPEFKIRHGLVPGPPPLPHSISVEVVGLEGKPLLDMIFPKGTPLPAEKTVMYRAVHALIPGKSDSNIYIKLWEGEFLEAPDANEPVSTLELRHDGVSRKLPEGEKIEVTVEISSSRLITATAFVPSLNRHFTDSIYLAQRSEEDLVERFAGMGKELRDLRDELQDLSRNGPTEADFQHQLKEIQSRLFELEYKTSFSSDMRDADETKRFVAEARSIHGRILCLRYRMLRDRPHTLEDFAQVKQAAEVIEEYGTALEKNALSSLRRHLDRSVGRGEDKLIRFIFDEIEKLHYVVLSGQGWYWRDWIKALSKPGQVFVNRAEAKRQIELGQAGIESGDEEELKQAVRSLWRLLPRDEEEIARSHFEQSGVHK